MKKDCHREGETMQTIPTCDGSPRELAYRETDGLEVALLWNQCNDRLTVSVAHARTGEFFELEAGRDKALDVYYHPYSYAACHTALYADARLAA
jgi:hypothetical protein